MSSTTTRLGLKRPDGSDSFLRTDFVDNYNKLDATPGYFPCLSTSRPAWGAAQTGMLIVETDTGRILRWTGSAWDNPTNQGQAWAIAANPNAMVVNNTGATFTVAGSIPVPRTCKMVVMLSARFFVAGNAHQFGSIDTWIDGSSCGVGGSVTWHMAATTDSSANHSAHPTQTGERVVGAGNHSVQCRVTIGTFAPDIQVSYIRGLVILSE